MNETAVQIMHVPMDTDFSGNIVPEHYELYGSFHSQLFSVDNLARCNPSNI